MCLVCSHVPASSVLNSRKGIFAESWVSSRVEQSGPNGAKTNSISQKLRHSQRSSQLATNQRRIRTKKKGDDYDYDYDYDDNDDDNDDDDDDDDRHLSPCPPCEQRLPFMQTYSPADVYLFANLISVPLGEGAAETSLLRDTIRRKGEAVFSF